MRRIQQHPPKLIKGGAFFRYSMDGIVTIEGILTSFDMGELSLLSYARELRSQDWDFDLLIQRDLDEARARNEIGTYLLPEDTEDKIVFLPPLIAAIVITNEQKKLEDYYPQRADSVESDDSDDSTESDSSNNKIYLRKWGTALEVRNYSPVEGMGVKIEHDPKTPRVNTSQAETTKTPRVDTSQAEIIMNYPQKDSSGIKLVVIDGQHRLFALLDRYDPNRENRANRERIENLLIPVMLVYPPNATKNNHPHTRKIPNIFRQLFVDVNKNAMNVSGHFIILLTDTTLGSMICRSFCQKIINDKSENTSKNNLALIEWNTRSDKDSKTIIKEYSITSIGVLYDALDSIFKEKNKRNLLLYIMGIGIDDKLFRDKDKDKDEDEDEELPELFPWQEFTLKDKSTLEKYVDKTFTPCLFQIFFHSKCYGEIKKSFDHAFENISAKYKNRPAAIKALWDNLECGKSLDIDKAREIKEEFIQKFDDKYNPKKPSIDIIRRKIFQKGMISAWIDMLNIAQEDHQLDALDTTKEFVKLLDHAINIELFVNDNKHSYLQESVFRNHRIIVTNYGKTQISYLILACLEDINHNNPLDLKFNPTAKEKLAELGKNAKIDFLEKLETEKIKVFKKTYKADADIDPEIREDLEKLERLARSEEKSNGDNQKNFNKEIKKQIQSKYDKACTQLDGILG